MMRRKVHFNDFAAVLADAQSLLEGGYDRAGNWTLSQVCDHLGRIINLSIDGFPSLMPWPVRQIARWFFLPGILARKIFKQRMPAPGYLQPASEGDDGLAVGKLQAALDRFAAHTGPFAPSPVFGQLTAEQWRAVHLWHLEHHFSFLLPKAATRV